MVTIDSSGWIELLMNGPLAEQYASFMENTRTILSPSIVVYEVYKFVKRERGAHWALSAAEFIGRTHVIPLSDELACQAADRSIEHGLSMADSVIYATAQAYGAKLITSDADFKDLPGVQYISSEE